MSNNKQQTAVDSIIELCQELLANHYSISHDAVCSEVIKFCQEQAKEMEVMGKEMSYADGYKEGYKRGLELIKWNIENELKKLNKETNENTN
jgi:flagellar biosynthesis/type III secretory pathway protein FliH